jgi:hypothetical protein
MPRELRNAPAVVRRDVEVVMKLRQILYATLSYLGIWQ